jgi:GTPase SAR1 family protein
MSYEEWKLVALGKVGVGTTTFMLRIVMGQFIGN